MCTNFSPHPVLPPDSPVAGAFRHMLHLPSGIMDLRRAFSHLSFLRSFSINNSHPNHLHEVRFTSDVSATRFHLVSRLSAIHSRRANNPARKPELELRTTISCLDAFSGVIYVPPRSDCDALTSRLRVHNIRAAPYHSGLSALDRTICEQKWIANEPGYAMVAITAFGMGTDKQDVRFLVH